MIRNINAALKIIAGLKRETSLTHSKITIKEDGTYSCTFYRINQTLQAKSFIVLLNKIVDFIMQNRVAAQKTEYSNSNNRYNRVKKFRLCQKTKV